MDSLAAISKMYPNYGLGASDLVVRFTNNVLVRIDFWYKEVNPKKNPARKGSRYARSCARSLYLP